MSGFRVVLDSCVLVPIVKADLLLTLAARGAFRPLWSDRLLGELGCAVVAVNPRMTEQRIADRINDMNSAFEDALVTGWEPLEDGIADMPDPDDRHVVAVAVRGNAAAIVTDNRKDFPDRALEPWGLHAVTSDGFLLDILDLHHDATIGCLVELAAKRRRPPVTVYDLLDALDRAGTVEFVREVRTILDG